MLDVAAAYMNDLWSFNINTNNWAWMTGSSSGTQQGTYGTIRVEAAGNTPGSRVTVGGTFDPRSGSLYIYGGHGYATTGTAGKVVDKGNDFS